MVQTESGDEVRRARAGDRLAFQCLMEPLYEPGFRLAAMLLNDRAEGEDAVQEAMFSAWRKFSTFRPEAELRPWFLAIVANQCRQMKRRRWWSVLRQPHVTTHAATGEESPVEEFAVAGHDLRVAMRRLNADQRLVLILHFCLDLPFEEVASTMHIAPAAARARTSRAVARLRDELGGEL